MAQSVTALSHLIQKEGVTVLNQTPAAFRQLTEVKEKAAGPSADLRLIICGGDVFRRDLASSSITWNVPVWNFYETTEATVWSTMGKVESIDAQAETIPIGHPIANTRVYLLDQSLNAVPTGASGELYISGKGLARDYVNRPELTAEKFVPDPFSDQPGARLYRTGDLARYLSDGSINFGPD